ncbi:MAG: hypothetical protein ACRDTA_17270 [Pseudonocardiaceae bacterium]
MPIEDASFGLTAHRPLGSINRVRRPAYEALGAWRHEVNATEERGPISMAEVPDQAASRGSSS